MAKIRKTVCIVLEWFALALLAVVPGAFVLHENVFRQLPLYRFLEEQAGSRQVGQDWETYEKLVESNAKYLGEKVTEENQKIRNIQPSPKISEEEKGEEDVQEQTEEIKEIQEIEDIQETEEVQQEILAEEESGEEEKIEAAAQVEPMPEINLSPEALESYDYLMNHFFILDSNTETSAEQLNAAALLGEDLTLPKEQEVQILIYHSHSQEAFADSREGEVEDTIVGVGSYLTEILTETYGYQVMHVTEAFDMAGGELDRSKAYDYARAWLEPFLEENPSVEVLIDLHRDGVTEDRHLVTEIDGKPTAQIMFYNGLSHTVNSGDLSYLPNPYIQDNLAFSFQLEYQAALYYPEFYRGIYLAGLRYNLHLRPRALLLEAGAQTNTVQEVKNAMEPFAEILDRVLQGK